MSLGETLLILGLQKMKGPRKKMVKKARTCPKNSRKRSIACWERIIAYCRWKCCYSYFNFLGKAIELVSKNT